MHFYAATESRTHVSLVAPLLRALNPGHFTDWATAAVAKSQTKLKPIIKSKMPLQVLQARQHRSLPPGG